MTMYRTHSFIRSILVTAFAFLLPMLSFAQDFRIKLDSTEISINDLQSSTFKKEIKKISIKKVVADNPAKPFLLQSGDEMLPFMTDGTFHDLTFSDDIRGAVSILGADSTEVTTFSLPKGADEGDQQPGAAGNGPSIVLPKEKTPTQYILSRLFPGQVKEVEGLGLKILSNGRPTSNTRFGGPGYIHLFFDQNGNSLIHSIPVGIARTRYVVHIVYLVPKNNPMNVDYQAVQEPADIDEGIVIQNDGSLQNNLVLHAKPKDKNLEFEWRHYEIDLTPSSNDIKFDIMRSGYQLNNNNLEMSPPVTVASRMIKMKKIYHGTIEVGIVQTNIEDPAYALSTSPTDASQKVVKRTNDGKRILATAMYTFYLSPVVLIEKLFQPSKVQNYRLEGRSFVDDHKIYERIYPSIGIGLNDRLLDNVFLGLKFEFIRGGSFFAGYNRSKVNVFEADETFKFGETHITQESFDIKSVTKWKGGFCFGLNLDVRIVLNLFQRTP